MKAMILEAPNTPFILRDVPDPVAGPGEAVAKVYACGSGLTIQHYKAGRTPAVFPRIIGHEICAEIVEVGSGVSNLSVGDIVTSYFYMNCGTCKYCLSNHEPLCENLGGYVGRECDGGYAEYIKLPSRWFIKLPDGLDWQNQPAHLGVAMDALATPYKVLRRARIRPGESVAVFGAGGGLGIHQVMLAKWAKARVIGVDTKADKFDAIREAGAEEIVDASNENVVDALMDLTNGKGVDVCVDYVSAQVTLEAATSALGKHGRMVTLGGAG
jgi:D-arabinose 1-dehydrogenase-like Zn-dependent alcohol dehydrogenase